MFWKIALRQAIEKFGGQGSGNFGHVGRPGEVGGSAPGSGGLDNSNEISDDDSFPITNESHPTEAIQYVKDRMDAVSDTVDTQRYYEIASNDWVREYGQDSGWTLEYGASIAFGGDINLMGRTLSKQDAINEFESTKRTWGIDESTIRKMAEVQYGATQKILEAYNQTGWITLYRGLENKSGNIPAAGKIDIELDALSSWTTDISIAQHFSSKSKSGRIISMTVDTSDIFACPVSNPALFDYVDVQDEWLVLGRGKTRTAEVVSDAD